MNFKLFSSFYVEFIFLFFFFLLFQVSNFTDYNNDVWLYNENFILRPRTDIPSKNRRNWNGGLKFLNNGLDRLKRRSRRCQITATLHSGERARNGKKVNETAPKSSGLSLYKFLMTHIFAYARSRSQYFHSRENGGFMKEITKVEISS